MLMRSLLVVGGLLFSQPETKMQPLTVPEEVAQQAAPAVPEGITFAETAQQQLARLWVGDFVVTAVVAAVLLWFLYWTRGGIIARATTKEAVRQPVFILLALIAVAVIVLNTFLPFFSLGEDVKMAKDCGLATILISGMLLATWTASTSIADEIEGKTAITLLSKPVNRRQFVIGKYVGILVAVFWLFLPMVVAFLASIYYRAGYYDTRESSTEASAQLAMEAVIQVFPGVILIYFETAVVSAVSVAISTRLPMIVNMVSCLVVFVVGHLTSVMVQAGVLKNVLVEFFARLFATVLPALDVFNISASIATGSIVPREYLAWSGVYCIAYSSMAILLAFILFEDRDLA
jgi:ABC-type transport system involved in multi-copper enzyme maturation permease subunit